MTDANADDALVLQMPDEEAVERWRLRRNLQYTPEQRLEAIQRWLAFVHSVRVASGLESRRST